MDQRTQSYIRSDYHSALSDFGIKHEDLWVDMLSVSIVEGEEASYYKTKSPIHGDGIFAKVSANVGEVICHGVLNGNKTIAGRYVNHSPYPNSFMYRTPEDDILFVALKNIEEDEEITTDYRANLMVHGLVPLSLNEYDIVEAEHGRAHLSEEEKVMFDLLFNEAHVTHLSLVDRIYAFEDAVSRMPQSELPVEHEFIDGMYKRTCIFPKGTLATGKVHTEPHFDVMLTGEMMVATPDGFKHLKAPMTFVSEAGNKKAGYAMTEVKWVTYHATEFTTVEEVEKQIFQSDVINDAYDIKDLYNKGDK